MLHAKYSIYLTWTFDFKKRSSFSLQNPCNTIWKILLATLLKLGKENRCSVTFIQCYPDWMKLLITSRGLKNKRKQTNKQTQNISTVIALFSAIKIQLAGIVALAPSFHFHCAKEEISPSAITLDGQYHSFWLLRKKRGQFKKTYSCITFTSKKHFVKGLWLFSHSRDLWKLPPAWVRALRRAQGRVFCMGSDITGTARQDCLWRFPREQV